METNEITGQGQPGQNMQPEQLVSATAAAQNSILTLQNEQPPLYDPGLTARMADRSVMCSIRSIFCCSARWQKVRRTAMR